MATDKTGAWSFGESVLWYTPTTGIDSYWSFGESAIRDEYIAFLSAKIGGVSTGSVQSVVGVAIGSIGSVGGKPK